MTIPSIGPVGAAALAVAVTDPQQFRSGREFAAWLALTPRQVATVSVKAKRTRASPRNRVLPCPAADFTQPNTFSIRLRMRILAR